MKKTNVNNQKYLTSLEKKNPKEINEKKPQKTPTKSARKKSSTGIKLQRILQYLGG
jgi:hypothetical protein